VTEPRVTPGRIDGLADWFVAARAAADLGQAVGARLIATTTNAQADAVASAMTALVGESTWHNAVQLARARTITERET
jgi:hypothetical protein